MKNILILLFVLSIFLLTWCSDIPQDNKNSKTVESSSSNVSGSFTVWSEELIPLSEITSIASSFNLSVETTKSEKQYIFYINEPGLSYSQKRELAKKIIEHPSIGYATVNKSIQLH